VTLEVLTLWEYRNSSDRMNLHPLSMESVLDQCPNYLSMLRPKSLFFPSVTFPPSIIRVLGKIGQKGKELL
jgi:hypothetical protein